MGDEQGAIYFELVHYGRSRGLLACRCRDPNCLDCKPALLDRRRYNDRLPGSALRHEDRSLDLGEAAPVGGYTRPPQNFDPIIANKVIFSIAVACGTL